MFLIKLHNANATGSTFNIRAVKEMEISMSGLVYTREDPLVEIFDSALMGITPIELKYGQFVQTSFYLSELLEVDEAEGLTMGRGVQWTLSPESFGALIEKLCDEFSDMRIVQLHKQLRALYNKCESLADYMGQLAENLVDECKLVKKNARRVRRSRTRPVFRDSLTNSESLMARTIQKLQDHRIEFYNVRNSTGELQEAITKEAKRLQGEGNRQ